MIEFTQGNLLDAPVEALVNTVNTEGVMGKGIALQFRQAFPEMYKAYEKACRSGQVQLGIVHVYDLGGLAGGPRWIINFPTKGHWRARSKIQDIEAGLEDLKRNIRLLNIKSIAVPPLGCGNGGLDWAVVAPYIKRTFEKLPEVRALIYPPNGTPLANDMPNRTEKPNMTDSRAIILTLVDRYLQGLLDPVVTLLEVHKLMYFMQEAGENLKLNFEPNYFGPYATNLRHVMVKLEGHYLQGYGDGEDNPAKLIELKEGAVAAARHYLQPHLDTLSRMDRVASLIEGFEDPYGMELLSTVHWVMCHEQKAQDSVETAISAVHSWNARKRTNLKTDHLKKAWDHLKSMRWDIESRSAAH